METIYIQHSLKQLENWSENGNKTAKWYTKGKKNRKKSKNKICNLNN
jgi:hypothetical protein